MAAQVIAMQEAQELPPETSFVFFLKRLSKPTHHLKKTKLINFFWVLCTFDGIQWASCRNNCCAEGGKIASAPYLFKA